MKMIFALILAVSAVQAKSLKCSQNEGTYTMYMTVTAQVEGEFYSVGERAVFKELEMNYSIYMDSIANDNLWSQGQQTFNNVANSTEYRPAKYKDHMKFNVYLRGIGFRSGFGELDLILPTKNLMAEEDSEFKGYLMMTNMDDHFGGTVHLDCSVD